MPKTIDSPNSLDALEPTNDGEPFIDLGRPYQVTVEVTGVASLLCHRWSDESVEAKARAAKGSTAKKTDDVMSYVYRTPDGFVGLSGTQLFGSIAGPQGAAKYRQDPRSPRKSALDLFRAAVVVLDDVTPLYRDGEACATWEYLDRRRVMVQRQGITRVRPAFMPGWVAEFNIMCNLPQYVPAALLLEVLVDAGRLCGVGDFRPSFGRFQVTSFKTGEL
jgi:hypothetical protein